MPTKYADIILYLDSIAANANGDVSSAPHGYWWHLNQDGSQRPLTYNEFITGTVHGIGVPIIDRSNPLQSLFYLLLSTKGGTQGYNQMPWHGPYLTDPGATLPVGNNPNFPAAQIITDMKEWLGNGYPE